MICVHAVTVATPVPPSTLYPVHILLWKPKSGPLILELHYQIAPEPPLDALDSLIAAVIPVENAVLREVVLQTRC